jgi:hypothetical protein
MKKTISLLAIFIFFIGFINAGPRKVLLEYSTSISCMYCACLDSIIKQHIIVSFPQTVVMAYHGNELPVIDPYSQFFGHEVRDSLLGPEVGFSAPMSFIDRSTFHRVSYPYAYDSVAFRYSSSPNAPVDINITAKNYNSSTRLLTVTAELKALQTLNGHYRVNFAITENNLINYQAGGPCGPASNNFDHDWVARTMANGWDGELIINGSWNANQVYTKNFNVTIDTGWVANNCDFEIFVYKRIPDFKRSDVQQAFKSSVTGSIGIRKENTVLADYYLWQNYPNPFNPATNIKFSIPRSENVSLKIYNIIGTEIMTVFNGRLEAGIYNAEFDARLSGSANLSSGVYYYVLKTDNFTDKKKMILLK